MNVVSYKLVTGYDADVEKQVNKLLEDGWELFGPPAVAWRRDDDEYVCQGMVLTEETCDE